MLLLTALLSGCGASPAPFPIDPGAPTFTLSLEPTEVEVVTGPDGTDAVTFQAFLDEGSGPEPAERVTWMLSNRSVGSLGDDGVFVPSITNGGTARVTATLSGIVAEATLRVRYRDQIVLDDLDADAVNEALSATAAPLDDAWTYPPDGVAVPRNTPTLHFQWRASDATAWRLAFRTATTEIDVLTTRSEWIADERIWTTIAATNAGGSVDVVLTGLFPDGPRTAPARTVRVNRLDADGSVIYWSTSRSGLVEIPYGLAARDFLTPAETGGRCVACHAVSRGGRVAFTYDGGDGALGLKTVADRTDVRAPDPAEIGNFHTFSPDDRFLVSAARGALVVFDAATGARLHTLDTGGAATHPDWSPDGDRLVFVLPGTHHTDWILSGPTSLVVADHDGQGHIQNPRVVHVSAPGTIAYYPAFSPDGAWIAFNTSTGDAYDDPDATVWVVPADGSLPAIPLGAANADGALTNSWPRWAPLPDDDILWIAFASKRPYGNLTNGTPQIWVASFDPALASAGLDPSTPAFWLPNQDVLTNNHIPIWTD